MRSLFTFLTALSWAAFAGGAMWCILSVVREATYVTLADGRRQERRLPLLFRLLLPLTAHLVPLFRRPGSAKLMAKTERTLVAAGFSGLIAAEELWALRLVLPVICGGLLAAFFSLMAAMAPPRVGLAMLHQQSHVFVILLLLFFAWPGLWLRAALRTRQHSIQRALPFVLDLLTLSVEAGLDFMTAMQRITSRRQIDALSEELLQVIREIQLGKTRRAALRDMSTRADQGDLRTVVNALVQADELGVGIAQILRIQSDQMRQRRFERAEKLGNEAPVKLLLPLVVFIFPSVFLVLLGPIVLQMMRYM